MNWATILDQELLGIRRRHAARLAEEWARRAAERQRVEDQRIVATREANIAVRRILERVR